VWYFQYFNCLRQSFPKLKIAILQVTADEESVLERARKRGKVTGRVVPDVVIQNTIAKIPASMALLSPLADCVSVFTNEDNEPLRLLHMCERSPGKECTAQRKSVFYDSNWAEDETCPTEMPEISFEAFRDVW
jgi:hypothetical protein